MVEAILNMFAVIGVIVAIATALLFINDRY